MTLQQHYWIYSMNKTARRVGLYNYRMNDSNESILFSESQTVQPVVWFLILMTLMSQFFLVNQTLLSVNCFACLDALHCFNVIRPTVANSSLFGAGVFCFFLHSFVPPESCRHHHHISSRFRGRHPCCLQHELSGGKSNFEPCNFKLTCQ